MNDEIEHVTILPEMIERTRLQAHKLWEDAGRPEGRAEEHWLAAETTVKAEMDAEQAEMPIWLKRGEQPPEAKTEESEKLETTLSDIRKRVQARSVA